MHVVACAYGCIFCLTHNSTACGMRMVALCEGKTNIWPYIYIYIPSSVGLVKKSQNIVCVPIVDHNLWVYLADKNSYNVQIQFNFFFLNNLHFNMNSMHFK